MREDESIRLPDGRKIGFAEYGDLDGRPLIFFHGWPSCRYQARLLHDAAKNRGVRVVAPDRPGVGLSDPLPGRGFSTISGDIAGLTDLLGFERFDLLGVSGGGPYALATAASIAPRITATAVVCGAPPLSNLADRLHLHWMYRILARLDRLRRHVVPGMLRFSQWMVDRGTHRAPMTWLLKSIPESDRRALDEIDGWDSVKSSYLEAIRNGTEFLLEDGELYLSPWDFEPELIQVPVTFWHGTADCNLPCDGARKLAARVPGAEGRWIDGEGHYSLPLHYAGQVLDRLEELGAAVRHEVRPLSA